MPPADKRQRKKENARMAREAREAAEKRRRRFHAARNVGLVLLFFIILFGAISFFTRDDNKKSSAAASTTTTVAKVALPAGCVEKVPPKPKPQTFPSPPPMSIDPTKTYTAKITTTCGDVTIALDAKNAPKSVSNFVFLAKAGFYKGLPWHRVAQNPPVVQGGDPKGTGSGGPGYSTVVELPPDGKYPAGAVAWAKTGNDPDGSAGSQFFIDYGNATGIGDHYGYIGKVSKGMDAVNKMATQATVSGTPANPLYIFNVTITES